MKKLSAIQAGWLYAFVHFSVEVACFHFLYARLMSGPMAWALAMLYDSLAFVPQSFIGLLTDRFPRLHIGAAGSALMLSALLMPWDIPALILIGTGNALLHIDGARHTLRGGGIAPCGIFVGGGSFGVITGQLLGKAGAGALLPAALMCVSAAAVVFVYRRGVEQDTPAARVDSSLGTPVLCALIFAVVAIRAYIGYAIPTEWNKTAVQAALLFCCMGAGKLLGGIMADRIGYRRTAYISLGLALPFLLFGNSVMTVSLIGVGLFSMTMPLTIGLLVSRMPEAPGFSFGITTVALFAGSLPAFFLRPAGLIAHQATVLILSAAALGCLTICIKKGR